MKMKCFYVKVQMPWGTITHYQVSKDLYVGLNQQLALTGECQSILKGALLNVPIIEYDFQHHYHKFVVPAKVLAVFIKNHRCEWHTRGQFISKDNLNFDDENQLRYLQHDYSKLNKWVIKQCWDIWKVKSTGK